MEQLSAGQAVARKHGFSEPYGLVWKESRGPNDIKVYVLSYGFRSVVRFNQFIQETAAQENFAEFVEGWSEDRVLTKQYLDELTQPA